MYSDFGICFQEFETLAARLITMEVRFEIDTLQCNGTRRRVY